ncbi:MAG: DUF721 domain-containing protein [Candidatus Berkiella sp.]
MTSSSYLVSNLLQGEGSTLTKLIEQAQAVAELNKTLEQVLDSELIAHCRVGYYEKGVLTLLVQSAAFATRLRYFTPTILSKLRTYKDWVGLCSIQIKIETIIVPTQAELTPKEEYKPPQKLSVDNAQRFQALADSMKANGVDDTLVASLERLAKNK